MSLANPLDLARALSRSRLVIFLQNTWRGDDAQAMASRTRALYLDYISNSSVGVFISLALYLTWPGMSWAFLQGFMVVWIVYLSSRLIAGIVFACTKSMSLEVLRRWSRLPILIQLIDGVMLGGHGGHSGGDGLAHGNAPISTATIPPLEILEAAYPVRFTEWSLRADSGGDGRHRGGLGAVYEIELLEKDAEVFVFGERGTSPPKGIAGGGSG
eukprot:gene1403-1821_t